MPREEETTPKDENETKPVEILDADLEEVAGGLLSEPSIVKPIAPKFGGEEWARR